MPPELMRKSDFARSQGWVPSYVSKLSKEGRLIYGPDGKLVDVQKTLALLGKTADPSKAGVTQRHAQTRAQQLLSLPTDDYIPGPNAGAAGLPDFQRARATREHYMSELARVELDNTLQRTVERAVVERTAYSYGRLTRDVMMIVPDKLADTLSTMTDPWEIRELLADALRAALADVAKMSAHDLADILPPGAGDQQQE